MMDDGRLTDGQGRTVDFKNVVVILTSSLGTVRVSSDRGESQAAKDEVMDELKSQFRRNS